MQPKTLPNVRSSRRNDPLSLALFLCAYAAILAFVIFS